MYNLLRITPRDEWKTAFLTREEHFKSLLLPFGLINTTASHQTFINDALAVFLDRYVRDYFDEILIYSGTLDKHRVHVRCLLEGFSGA